MKKTETPKTSSFKKHLIYFILIIGLLPCYLFSGQGSAGAQFLQIFPGVRGTVLGGAYYARGGNIQSLYWNPAGIRSISGTSVSITHGDYFVGMKNENAGFAMQTPFGTIGVQFSGLLSGEIEETTEVEDEGTGHNYTANSYAIGLSYARSMTNKFDAGVTFKMLNQNLAKVSAKGWAFDIGALYKTGLPGNLRIGFCIKNFGPDMKYEGEGLEDLMERSEIDGSLEDMKYSLSSEEYAIPMSFHLGGAFDININHSSKIIFNLDANNSVDQKESISVGLEYNMLDFIYVGIGHGNAVKIFNNKLTDEDMGGNMRGLSVGGGINFGKYTSLPFWVEYAWESHKYLEAIHRFGLELGF